MPESIHDVLIQAACPLGAQADRHKYTPGWAFSRLPEEVKERLRNLKASDLQNFRIQDWLEPKPATPKVFCLKIEVPHPESEPHA